MRLVVSRTARLCTSGTIINPNSIETRKPIARYMIGSTMDATPREKCIDHNAMGNRVNASIMPRLRGSVPWRLQAWEIRNPVRSERVPGRARGIFEIADIGAKAQAETGADRHQDDAVGSQRGHPEAANDIGRAIDAAKALVDRIGCGEIVDKRHGTRAVAAPVEADRRPLPVDPQIAGILGIERAFAVSQSGDKGARTFLAKDIAVRQAPLADRALDHRGQAARYIAEKPVSGADQFVRSEGVAAGLVLRRRRLRGLLGGSGHGPAQQRGERHRGKA